MGENEEEPWFHNMLETFGLHVFFWFSMIKKRDGENRYFNSIQMRYTKENIHWNLCLLLYIFICPLAIGMPRLFYQNPNVRFPRCKF